MQELNYDFRKRLNEVHTPNRRDYAKLPSDNQTILDESWTIVIPQNADKVMYNAARDFEEYLFISMDIPVKVAYDCGGCASKAIKLSLDDTLAENEYRVTVTENAVYVAGADSRSAAQGLYWLEDLMNLEEAPYLDRTDIKRKPLYSPRMIHSGYGLDIFPDVHIRMIAHYGINALLVFVKDIDRTPFGYLDFNDLINRAANWGVDVYCYSYMKSRLHPDDPKAEEFYESVYGRLFDRCPGFKGVIFVGESVEFPSHDPHTTGMLRLVNQNPDGTKKNSHHLSPGWWPCYDLPQWVNLVKGIIRKRKPDADFVLWSYNWSKRPTEDRLKLIDNLPTDISLLVNFQTDRYVTRRGYTGYTADYNLWYEGPGITFETESKRAAERGIRLYTMSNTGGLTWDMGTIPYEPAPQQWMRRYAGMQEAHDKYGLCGTMDSHHFGFWPSFISELAKWAFYAPVEDYMTVLRRIVKRDFGEENVDTVVEAYDRFSEGVRSLISNNYDQYGPLRIGSSYPLVMNKEKKDIEIPTVFYAHFGGNIITHPVYTGPVTTPEGLKQIERDIAEHGRSARMFLEGALMIDGVIDTLPERKQENAKRIAALGHFMANAATTSVNTKEWYKRRHELRTLAASETPDRERIEVLKAEMCEIGSREIENARNTIPYVEFDSRLGFEPSMEYMTDRAHLEWKIGVVEEAMEEVRQY